MDTSEFDKRGWATIPYDADLHAWAKCALPAAKAAAADTAHHPMWMRAQGTWFVGVDVLGNDPSGRVTGSAPLAGEALEHARSQMGADTFDWGHGQVSVCYQGYPKKDADETDGMFNYRRNRDFAHLDGLKPIGPDRRRMMDEFHGFIMGIPLNDFSAKAAPFVIWEGSHIILQDMLIECYAGVDPADWPKTDVTEIYQNARNLIFDTCQRVEIHVKPGAAYIAHRFCLHGMANWPDDLAGPAEGRVIAYFRPYWQSEMPKWLTN